MTLYNKVIEEIEQKCRDADDIRSLLLSPDESTNLREEIRTIKQIANDIALAYWLKSRSKMETSESFIIKKMIKEIEDQNVLEGFVKHLPGFRMIDLIYLRNMIKDEIRCRYNLATGNPLNKD